MSRAAGRRDEIHDVVIIGNSGHLALARRCGVRTSLRIGATLNRPVLGRRALGAMLEARAHSGAGYDLLHAWTLNSAVAAALVAEGRPVLGMAPIGYTGRLADLNLLGRHRVPILAATATVESELISAGYQRDLVTVLEPTVDPGAIDTEARGPLRESWDADETTFVVALLSELYDDSDGVHAMHAAARIGLTGKDIRIVLHHRPARWSLRWQLPKVGLPGLIVVDDRVIEPWRVVAGLDAAFSLHHPRDRVTRRPWGLPMSWAAPAMHILPGRRGPARARLTPLLWAMAAGVPAIAEADRAGDWIEDGDTGLLTTMGDHNRTAARLLDLHDNPAMARRVGTAGRKLIEARFNGETFISRLALAWRQCLHGERIELGEGAVPYSNSVYAAS
jgi:glycosyltransferase involved in cell wall biosynthesis